MKTTKNTIRNDRLLQIIRTEFSKLEVWDQEKQSHYKSTK